MCEETREIRKPKAAVDRYISDNEVDSLKDMMGAPRLLLSTCPDEGLPSQQDEAHWNFCLLNAKKV